MDKKTHGGSRINSGRKGLYGEPTKVVPTSVPVSKVVLFKEVTKNILKNWIK